MEPLGMPAQCCEKATPPFPGFESATTTQQPHWTWTWLGTLVAQMLHDTAEPALYLHPDYGCVHGRPKCANGEMKNLQVRH